MLKSYTYPNNPVFFVVAPQSFEMFPKHNGFDTMLESFALNLKCSTPLTNK